MSAADSDRFTRLAATWPGVGGWNNACMSPRSRGRPPGRGRPRRPGRRSAANDDALSGPVCPLAGGIGAGPEDDYWFEDPAAGERRAWAMPAGHGSFQGLDLELLDPADEDQLMLLMEAHHPEMADALRAGEEIVGDDFEPINPRLHIAMHQIVANQLLADDPPETWPTVQRLAHLGYDWHNIMHMIAAVVSDDIHAAMTERLPFDAADHARRLGELPGDWPPPDKP